MISKYFFSNVPVSIVLAASLLISNQLFAQGNPQLMGYSSDSEMNNYSEQVFLDAELTLEEALTGQKIPSSLKRNLVLVDVQYYGFDEKLHQGQLIVHKDAEQDIKEIFEFIRFTRFPIDKVVPACEYKWSDEESMKENNTCSFNYRFISGTRIMSMHANGLAIDINPKLNPYTKNGITLPEDAIYDTDVPGTISADSRLVEEFKKRGWEWGGDWKSLKDYQHFQKTLIADKED
jgi:hypothetical protein